MATSTIAPPEPRTLADLVRDLGNISLERIRFPAGTATEEDLVAALEAADKRLYELVDGVLIEKVMGIRESILGGNMLGYLWNHSRKRNGGIPFGADGPIRLRPGRIRMPDCGFITWDRLPDGEVPDEAILDAVPDLTVEVISKGNTLEEMLLKLHDYFRAGVRLVWFIYPKTQTVVVYTSPTAKRTLSKDDTLNGGKVLPGFALPLKKLFALPPKTKPER
jgi:Uma2 family endonuclease